MFSSGMEVMMIDIAAVRPEYEALGRRLGMAFEPTKRKECIGDKDAFIVVGNYGTHLHTRERREPRRDVHGELPNLAILRRFADRLEGQTVETLRAEVETELPQNCSKKEKLRKARCFLDLSDVLGFKLLKYVDDKPRNQVVRESADLHGQAKALGMPEAFMKDAILAHLHIERQMMHPHQVFPSILEILSSALEADPDFVCPALLAYAQEGASHGFFDPIWHPKLTRTLLRSDMESNKQSEAQDQQFHRTCSGPGCTVRSTTKGKGMLSKCPKCKETFYCGPQCQKAHWQAGHRSACKAPSPAVMEKPESKPASTCGACGKEGVSKTCSGCKQVKYCNRTCQSQHWKGGHKARCMVIQATTAADEVAPRQPTPAEIAPAATAAVDPKPKSSKTGKVKGAPQASANIGSMKFFSTLSGHNSLDPKMLGEIQRGMGGDGGGGNRFTDALECIRGSFTVGMACGVQGALGYEDGGMVECKIRSRSKFAAAVEIAEGPHAGKRAVIPLHELTLLGGRITLE